MNIPGMGNLMKKAQEMQQKMQQAEEEIAHLSAIGESGAGLVKVTLTGKFECTKVELDPTLLEEDKEFMEDLIAAALNNAVQKINTLKEEKMTGVTAGLKLPAGMDSLFK